MELQARLRRRSNAPDDSTTLFELPMTAGEQAKVAINARLQYASDLNTRLLPYVRSLPTFAGVSLDQKANSQVTVRLTRVDADVVAKIRALDPDASRGLQILPAKNSLSDLQAAMEAARSDVASIAPDVTVVEAAVDEQLNAVRLYVLPGTSDKLANSLSAVEGALGVSVVLDEEPLGDDTCTNRRPLLGCAS